MAPCAHVQWLWLGQDQDTFSLHYADRLQNITKSLPRPSEQYPSLLFFLGNRSKSVALRSIYPESRLSNYRHRGIANICLDPRTANDHYPVIIADGSPDGAAQITPSSAEGKCHETTSQSLDWSENRNGSPQRQDLIDLIHARLFSLFVDVICIFADDYGGLTGVVAKLTTWANLGSASSLPNTVRPRVLVVSRNAGDTFDSEVLRFRSQLFSTPKFSECFSSLNVMNILGSLRLSSGVQFSALKELLTQETLIARQSRLDSRTLFSSIHSACFFEKALRRFAKRPEALFNFIRASRDGNSMNQEFQDHVDTFLSLWLENKLPDNIPLSFISSAIVLDSFPPGMHLFDPSHVFHTLYYPLVLHGIENFARSRQLSSKLICTDIEAQMADMFSHMDRNHQSALNLRIERLRRYSQYWGLLKTTRKCLYCLRRKPEHILDCGHAICDVCVSIFGEPAKGLEYYFDISTCLLCQKSICFQARIIPPTCRVRFLSIDGGGSRGIVPLEFVDALQDAIGLPYPIQEHFDFGIGTSSGGIVLVALFVKYWDTKKCLRFFHKFARRVFQKFGVKRSIFAKVRWFFASYFADGQYDAVLLEEILQETFGSRPLFDSVGSRPSGMKVAVTATTISNATLCLFSNYNGSGSYSTDIQCKHLRPSIATNEVLLWEAARCTTAAPWYFKPKFLETFGTFQDGGLKYNNPVRPGLREVQRIWKDGDCDIVVSIGTGFKEQLTSPKAPNVRNLFQDGAVARLYRASMSSLSLDGGNSWKDHWHGLEEDTKGLQFRLDLPLKGKEPAIDDVDQMPSLQEQVRHNLGDLNGLARALKTASFFFELDEPSVREGITYRCRGSILCRSPNSRALLQNLVTTYPYSQFVTNTETSLGFLSLNDICQGCGRFQKTVSFSVRHPSDILDLHLVFNRLFRRSISGFPHPIAWFEDRQMMNARFGRADHKGVQTLSESDCDCVKRRRHMDSSYRFISGKRTLTLQCLRRSKRPRL